MVDVGTEQASATSDTSTSMPGWLGLGADVLGLLVGALARTRGQRQN